MFDGTDFATGTISSEADLQNWLAQRDGIPGNQRHGKLLGDVRLLICDRTQYTPLDFPLSRRAFASIETAFGLSPLTLPSLESEPGTYSRFLCFSDDDNRNLRSIREYPQLGSTAAS